MKTFLIYSIWRNGFLSKSEDVSYLFEDILTEVWPNKGESKDDFVHRFMSVTKDEYPDIKQRYAVCMSYWDRRNKKRNLDESEFSDDLAAIYGQSDEVNRIPLVLNNVKDIVYGFISRKDGSRIDDREWIHNCPNLGDYYDVCKDPAITLKNKLGICTDQSLLIQDLFKKNYPDIPCVLYALMKGRFGHCVPTFKDGENYYYLENAWDKMKGLHGPFASKEELEKFLDATYHKFHDKDNDDPVEVMPYEEYLKLTTLNESFYLV